MDVEKRMRRAQWPERNSSKSSPGLLVLWMQMGPWSIVRLPSLSAPVCVAVTHAPLSGATAQSLPHQEKQDKDGKTSGDN